MAQNVQIQYYNGTSYETLYPKTLSSLIEGNINANTLQGYSYNQIINNAQSGQSNNYLKYEKGSFVGTGSESVNFNVTLKSYLLLLQFSMMTACSINLYSGRKDLYILYIYPVDNTSTKLLYSITTNLFIATYSNYIITISNNWGAGHNVYTTKAEPKNFTWTFTGNGNTTSFINFGV